MDKIPEIPEVVVPTSGTLPQEEYLSELALPFAVITELNVHGKRRGDKSL